jgi:hypothetical protein
MLKGKSTPLLLCKHKLHAGKYHIPWLARDEWIYFERKNTNDGKRESNKMLSKPLLFIQE